MTARGEVWRWPANITYTHHPECDLLACDKDCPAKIIDSQSPQGAPASRIFYSTKAQTKEREAGLEDLPKKRLEIMRARGNVRPRANVHQTVKPIALMRWLARLTCPPGGLVLDPFTGSGSTGIATVLEGRQFLGVEMEPEYVRIAVHRIKHWASTDGERA